MVILCRRFRSELLLPIHAEDALSDADVANIATDIDAVVGDLRRRIGVGSEEALDQAMAMARGAEASGKLAPDPRSDAELKEEIRRAWDGGPSIGGG